MSFEKIKINLSLQEMFDMVCEHAAKQQCRSTSEYAGGCAYRGDYGTKCFAGIFIPDEKYVPEMEGRNQYDIFEAEIKSHLILGDFQYTHDNSEDVDNLKYRLERHAKYYRLDPAKVDLIEHWDIEEVKPYKGDW